jgi:hypothetical protein
MNVWSDDSCISRIVNSCIVCNYLGLYKGIGMLYDECIGIEREGVTYLCSSSI